MDKARSVIERMVVGKDVIHGSIRINVLHQMVKVISSLDRVVADENLVVLKFLGGQECFVRKNIRSI